MLFIALFFALLSAAAPLPGKKITSLPGYVGPPLGSKLDMQSGYIHVGPLGVRRLFYWLIRAENKDPKAPLVFWFTGGPGCSGLSALFSENGPLRMTPSGGVNYTNLGWSQVANMVFLEQPVFVGYSYSLDPLDRESSDEKSSKDNYQFVQDFIVAYPEFQTRDIYLTGESYAGEYVPHLTLRILSDKSTQVYKNFKGFMVGNPVMGGGSRSTGAQFVSFYQRGLVSGYLKAQWDAAGCTQDTDDDDENAAGCGGILSTATDQIGVIDQELKRRSIPQQPSLDPDSLWQDFCSGNSTLNAPSVVPVGCTAIGDLTTTYLNRKDVHAAIGAKGEFGSPSTWQICGGVAYLPSNTDQIPRYQQFPTLKPGIRMMVYSGDGDSATVPFTFTDAALFRLTDGKPVVKAWHAWFVGGQSVGYAETFQLNAQTQFTNAHIKGASHEVPTVEPYSAFHMFKRFITNGTVDNLDESPRQFFAAPSTLRQGDQLRNLLRKNRLIR